MGARAQSHDQDALEALLRGVQPSLRRYLSGVVGNIDADDLMQEVLMIVIRRLASLDDPKLFRPWLFRIASDASGKGGMTMMRTSTPCLLRKGRRRASCCESGWRRRPSPRRAERADAALRGGIAAGGGRSDRSRSPLVQPSRASRTDCAPSENT